MNVHLSLAAAAIYAWNIELLLDEVVHDSTSMLLPVLIGAATPKC